MALDAILRTRSGFGAAALGNMFRDSPEAAFWQELHAIHLVDPPAPLPDSV